MFSVRSIFIKLAAYCSLLFFSLLMVRITVPYFTFKDDVAFLNIKRWIIGNDVWKISFYVHVMSSCFCLIAGYTQFSRTILRLYPKVHRWTGYMYVLIVLFLSGPSGLFMALYANGGLLSQTAFTLLSVLWMYFTWQAYRKARLREFGLHHQFMIRSFALTLSALTLRAWKYLIVMICRPHPMDAYMIVAWLGWLPNLTLAEIYIQKKLRRQ